MKVMQFIHGLNTGGAETLVKDYVLKLDKNKFDIVVLCLEHYEDSPYEKLLEQNNIRVIYVCDLLPLNKSKLFVSRLIRNISRKFIVKKIIKDEKPDILHTHLTINEYIKFAKVRNECRIIHTVHNEPNVLWNNSRKRQKDFRCAQYLVKHNKMRFIVLHEKMRDEINNLFNTDNAVVLNNGIDFNRFNSKLIKNKNKFREELNIPIDALVIGHIGRFNEQKNHPFLVEVFSEVYKKNKDAYLLLIGDGFNKQAIIDKLHKMRLDNNYQILSNRTDIPDLINIMDYFVFPSLFEGLGIVLIEAQKMNTPCFVSDKVPEAASISNLMNVLSLNDSPKKWSETILKYKMPKKIVLNDDDWNMDKIVKRLEDIYLGKV